MSLIGFRKVCGTTERGGIIIPAGGDFCRLTTLPANWKKVRIAAIVSATSYNADNAPPIGEDITVSSEVFAPHIGLSSTPDLPGTAGNRFVGISHRMGKLLRMVYVSSVPTWAIASYPGWTVPYNDEACAMRSDSASVARSGNIYFGGEAQLGSPDQATACAFGLRLELDVSTAGTLGVAILTSPQITPESASESAMLSQLVGLSSLSGGSSGSLTGGWWSGTVPVGCQYLYFHYPFTLSRIRLLGAIVQQTL